MNDAQAAGQPDHPRGLGTAVVELTLLMSNQQMEALESAATRENLTVGQLLRRLVRKSFTGTDDTLDAEAAARAMFER